MPRKPSIAAAAKAFGAAHRALTKVEKRKAEKRAKFIEAVDANIGDQELARQIIYYLGEYPDAFIAVQYPRWRIIEARLIKADNDRGIESGEWKILLEEVPQYKNKAVVVEGMVYQRTIAESAPTFDEALMQKEDPELYARVTQTQMITDWKPIDTIAAEDKEAMMRYLQAPKLTVRVESPRKAKPEEMEES